ncbi:hypothetical protein, partial [Flavobacterium agri]|uniref:hypothetical protein n=1 Tax=Flavobacterium agri TaxID=2743471 RepID=UPI001C378B9F
QFFAFFQAFAASGTRLCDHGAGRRKRLLTFCLRAAQNACPREVFGKKEIQGYDKKNRQWRSILFIQ